MKDLPGVLLTATIWSYWIGVGVMIVRVRRKTHSLAGLVPMQSLEKLMWIVWVPVVVAWAVLPYLSLSHGGPMSLPSFFAGDPPYTALRWVAGFTALACLLLTSLCWARMGTSWRMDVRPDSKNDLITDGPFRYVRHPIYALSMMLMVCTVIVVPTFSMLLVAILHIGLMNLKARHEERHLLGVHGERYRIYVSHTGRFVPTIHFRRS